MRGFLDACRSQDFDRAAKFLDLSRLPETLPASEPPVLARRLCVVLGRKLVVNPKRFSDRPEGNPQDGLAAGLDAVGTIATGKGNVDILLERIEDEAGGRPWRIASTTVEQIPLLYGEYGYGVLGEVLPDPFFQIQFARIELWQWLGLLLLIPLTLALAWVLTGIVYRLARVLVSRTATRFDDTILSTSVRPLRIFAALGLYTAGAALLRLPARVNGFLVALGIALAIGVAAWLLFRLTDEILETLKQQLEEKEQRAAAAVVPLGRKAIKVVLIILAFLALLQNLGFNVTGVIAGLGVGGLAVALAAQKTVENLFGGVMLSADQPVRVGDFCRFGDKIGTVEDVGLRSTRIRTLDRTIVTVPNGDFSQAQIENFALRDKMRLYAMLGLRYETTPDQLRYILVELRKLLLSHPRVDPDPARVRFVGFGAYSLDLELFAYVVSADWNDFLAVREDIFLRIMKIIEEAGSGFAFPSQTTYLSRDGGLDTERTRGAEREVQAWREEGKLPFPQFSPEMITEMDDTLDYPPAGSATGQSV
jgi:MscS family membrane protein